MSVSNFMPSGQLLSRYLSLRQRVGRIDHTTAAVMYQAINIATASMSPKFKLCVKSKVWKSIHTYNYNQGLEEQTARNKQRERDKWNCDGMWCEGCICKANKQHVCQACCRTATHWHKPPPEPPNATLGICPHCRGYCSRNLAAFADCSE